ncbi:MAG: 3'(2'),5'-bisphosphate nucleotidase CysQ [Deltaproteobacteria bacterium]|nr:3'(2'),5'-bisphosphate nucleotidase CysQ [Deltaproteobacteria bacterium]
MQNWGPEVDAAKTAALKAGEVVRRLYEAGTVRTWRKADESVVTEGDLASQAAIVAVLAEKFPGDAVLSEEAADDPRRLGQSRVWIIDPIDGTRDFVERTGDFAIHVALAVDGSPTVGAVMLPATGALYFAAKGEGAFVVRGENETRLAVSRTSQLAEAQIGVSRFFESEPLKQLLSAAGLRNRAISMGASTKAMAIAKGRLDVTVALNRDEKDWDTCAPEVIVCEAGGMVTDLGGAPLIYNRATVAHAHGSVMSNGQLHAQLVAHTQLFYSQSPVKRFVRS